jgi:hypothetical protein
LLIESVDAQEEDPEEIVIVSPAVAFVTHVLTDA